MGWLGWTVSVRHGEHGFDYLYVIFEAGMGGSKLSVLAWVNTAVPDVLVHGLFLFLQQPQYVA
jgi:hypothetical protein